MAFLGRLIYGFCALSGIGTFPFLTGRNPFIKAPKDIIAPPAVVNEQPQDIKEAPQPSPPPLVEILKKEGYEGCELLKGQRGRKQVVYVCWKKDGSKVPAFYQYDKTKYQANQGQEANQITGITYQTSNLAILRFKAGGTENLNYPPAWMNKWKSRGEVKPESECSFNKIVDSRSSYKLTCTGYDVQTGIHFST